MVAMQKTRRKVAATVLALGTASAAVVFGSYAAWTAQSSNPGNSVTTGVLKLSNDKDAQAVFSAKGAMPGESGGGRVKIKNDGSVPMKSVTLTQGNVINGVGDDLELQVYDTTTDRCVWPTNAAGECTGYGAWDAGQALAAFEVQGLGGTAAWNAGELHEFAVNWSFDADTTNATQGKTGTFDLTWDGAQ